MKTLPLTFAEDFTGLFLMFAAICILPVACALFGLFITRRSPRAGFAFGLSATVIGSLLLLLLAAGNEGALPIFWILSSLPLLVGIVCLLSWVFRKRSSPS